MGFFKFLFKAAGAVCVLLMLAMCAVFSAAKPHETETRISDLKSTSNYFSDRELEERCKDYIYWRNQTVKLGREGDSKGAAHARLAMNSVYGELTRNDPESKVVKVIRSLESGGYKAGR